MAKCVNMPTSPDYVSFEFGNLQRHDVSRNEILTQPADNPSDSSTFTNITETPELKINYGGSEVVNSSTR